MKCYKHNDRNAVSQCMECSKTLCPECTGKYNKPICDSCAIELSHKNKKYLVKNIAISLIAFFIGSVIYADMPMGMRLFSSVVFSGVPWGWSFLNRITPDIFLFMPLVGWLIYFVVKFLLSLFIGLFIMPYKIYQIVKGLKEHNKLIEYANSSC